MGKTKNFVLIMGIFALVALIIGAKARTWASGGAVGQVLGLDINELISSPRTYLKGTVEFECRFATVGNLFRENTADFSQGDYINFAVWRPQAKLWIRADRLNLLPSLYVSKERKDLAEKVSQLPRYCNIVIRGKVLSSYANLPWIEVTGVKVSDDDNINDGMLKKAAQVSVLLKQKKYSDAKRVFGLINNKSTPVYIRNDLSAEISQAIPVKSIDEQNKMLIASARKAAQNANYDPAIALLLEARKFQKGLEKEVWFNQELASYYLSSNMTSKLELAKERLVIANSLAKGKNARILNMLADIELKRNNQDAAEEFIHMALAIDKDNSQAQKALAQITSEKLSSEVVEEDKTDSKIIKITPAYLNIGKEFLNKGDFVNAEKQLRMAVKDNKKEAVTLLASALLAQGKVQQAQELLAVKTQKKEVEQKIDKLEVVVEESAPILPVEPKASDKVEQKKPAVPEKVETDFNDVFAAMNEMKNDLEKSTAASFDENDTLALSGEVVQIKEVKQEKVIDSKPQVNEVEIKQEIILPKLPDIQAAPKNMSKLPDWAK